MEPGRPALCGLYRPVDKQRVRAVATRYDVPPGVLVPPQNMTSRISFGPEFLRAVQVRGLTLTELADRAQVSAATASAAARGRPVNMRTALQLSKALSLAPVVAELEAWSSSAAEA